MSAAISAGEKLYSIVSPNKSVEGALGGLAGSVIGAFIAKATFFPGLTAFDSLATALLLGILGQLGDLFESFLKRSFGVKDSGAIFPGHGGDSRPAGQYSFCRSGGLLLCLVRLYEPVRGVRDTPVMRKRLCKRGHMKKLNILGSTGSIGVSTLEIVAAHPDRFSVVALSAGNNLDLLARQIEAFSPQLVAVISEESAKKLRAMLPGKKPEIMHGVAGMIAVATAAEAEMVVAAIVGAAGLVPTAAAVKAGKDLALANKETLVTAGHLIMRMVKEKGVKLYPVDSEHSAIFQSLAGTPAGGCAADHPDCIGGAVHQLPAGETGAGFHSRCP